MKVKSLSESADRYVKGCIRAYLEGSKDFRWVTSIIGRSHSGICAAELGLARLGAYGDTLRRAVLVSYIAQCRHELLAEERPNI